MEFFSPTATTHRVKKIPIAQGMPPQSLWFLGISSDAGISSWPAAAAKAGAKTAKRTKTTSRSNNIWVCIFIFFILSVIIEKNDSSIKDGAADSLTDFFVVVQGVFPVGEVAEGE